MAGIVDPSAPPSTPTSALRRHLAATHAFASLDEKTAELLHLAEDCAAVGINLDELVVSMEAANDAADSHQAKRQRTPTRPTGSSGGCILDVSRHEPSAGRMLLTVAGRYCNLLGRSEQAFNTFRAALDLDAAACAPTSPMTEPATVRAQQQFGLAQLHGRLGLAKACLSLGQREQAGRVVLDFWREAQTQHEYVPTRAHIHLGILLGALAEGASHVPPDALALLRRLIPLLATPACAAVESLAARWLPSQVPAALRDGGEHMLLSEPFVQSALLASRTFGTLELEPLVCAARRQLLSMLCSSPREEPRGMGGGMGGGFGGMSGGGGMGSSSGMPPGLQLGSISVTVGAAEASSGGNGGARHLRIEAAAVLACWCHTAGFCLEESLAEAQLVGQACSVVEAGLASALHSSDWPLSHYTQLAQLAAVGMYQNLAELRAVEVWLREPEMAAEVERRLRAAELPRVWAMIETHVLLPRARARSAERLAVLTPIHSKAVRELHDLQIEYPHWHVACAYGVASSPSVAEKMRRRYRHFRWPHGEDATEHQMLIAGAGSGQEVAQALLTFQHMHITAIDLSARTLAFAQQKLHAAMPQEAARRVRFAVADVLAPPSASLPLFELVSAVGVLHHVPKAHVPTALMNLVASTKPGGVLQLGTYSTIGADSWWRPTRRLVHRLAPSIVSASGELLRQPAPHELRELRAGVMELERQLRSRHAAGHAHAASHAASIAGGHAPPASGCAGEEEEELRRSCSHVVRCPEFYTSTGCRDLLLHPCDCSFTLLELGQLLEGADLDLVGLSFASLEVDWQAREAYARSAAASGGYAAGDGPELQNDLRRWHAIEQAEPALFGRMHMLYAQKRVASA